MHRKVVFCIKLCGYALAVGFGNYFTILVDDGKGVLQMPYRQYLFFYAYIIEGF